MLRLEVWHSRRGRHVPPAGHAFIVDGPTVHLVMLKRERGADPSTESDPLTTRCDLSLDPAWGEVVVHARGDLCSLCADAAKLPTEGLEWAKSE